MPANGLKSMLETFEKVLAGEIPMRPEAINTLMLGGVISVLEEVRAMSEKMDNHSKKLDDQAKRGTTTDRKLVAVGIVAGLALAAIATHTGWTWLTAAAVP